MTRYQNNITLPDFYDSRQEEKKIIQFWTKQRIFEKVQSARRESNEEKLVFHRGPVFPTGSPHSGHIFNGIVKDALTRYAHQKNRLVESSFGWDCHGLPVEHLVDKELGIMSPEGVEALGLRAYNEECRNFVQRQTAKWKNVNLRIGNWVDTKNEYETMSTEYMEHVWSVFKSLYDSRKVYQDTKVLPYSTACHTHLSNFEAEQNCKEVTEKGYTISVDIDGSDEKFLVWTTNPCALASNSAVRVNPTAVYVKVNVKNNVYVLARNSVHRVFKNPNEYVVLKHFLGQELQDVKYKPLFDPISVNRDFHVLMDSSVSDDFGTGIVPLDEAILESLRERGHIYSEEEVKYKKPYCWRSDTPLITKKVSSWFIRVEYRSEWLVDNNLRVNWSSDKEKKQFGDWLKHHSQDWSISRPRYWGTPVPIWSSPSGDEIVCVGSIQKLKQLTGKKNITDLHRETVDWMVIPSQTPGKPPLRRVPDVFDCWFESALLPFINKEGPTQTEFAVEGIDQSRGWFYTTLVMSTFLSHTSPFRNIFATGLVQEPDGSKVSKRKHNHNDPARLIEKYGADCLRLYLLSSPLMRCESFVIQEEGVANFSKTVIQPLFRIFSECTKQLASPAWVNYGYITEWYNLGHPIDEWIVSYTESLLKFYDSEMKAYRLYTIVPKLIELIQQIEDWYIPIRRWDSDIVRDHPTNIILFNIIYRLILMLAPFAPFFTEYIYQIHRPFLIQWRRKESIHDALLLPLEEKLIHEDLELRVSRMQTVIETVRALRTQLVVPSRYQISEVIVVHHNDQYLNDIKLMKETIIQLLNAKDVRVSKDHREFGAKMRAELLPNSVFSDNQFIMRAIQDLTDEQLELLAEESSVSLLSETIPIDNIQISYQMMSKSEPNDGIAIKDDLIVIMRMNKPLFFYEEGTVKDITNRIGSLKKESGLYPSDPVVLQYETKEECLRNVMIKYGEHFKKTFNCDLRIEMEQTEENGTYPTAVCVDVRGLPIKLHIFVL